ncbi:MAG: hypothetical protein JO319_18050 [Acidobacteriaceae bacterium]|nr:hypothetical protein [Acidobacteriaceae bacterium]
MAIDYELRLCTRLDTAQIPNLLTKLAPGLETGQDPGTVLGTGVVISVLPESDLGKQITKEKYGLASNLRVHFRLDKFDGFEQGRKTTVKVSLGLLEAAKV